MNLAHRKIKITKSKNNEARVIPINKTLSRELSELSPRNAHVHVFCDPKGRPLGEIKKGFASAMRRAKIENFHFHDLRHTFGSQLIMHGADLRTVQQVMGHKEIKMTMRYAHLSPDTCRIRWQNLTAYGHYLDTKAKRENHKDLYPIDIITYGGVAQW